MTWRTGDSGLRLCAAGDEPAGILSPATISSVTPHGEPPANTDPDSRITELNKSPHTPHTTRCGVPPQPAGSIPLHTNILDVQRLPTAAVAPTTQAEATGAAPPATEETEAAPSATL